MTSLADHPNFELNSAFRAELEEHRSSWIDIGQKTRAANRDELEGIINGIYESSGKPAPIVVWCESIWQLTNLPLVFALFVDESTRSNVVPILREQLSSGPWADVWRIVDEKLGEAEIEDLVVRADKRNQEDTLKKVNRFIHRLHEALGDTVDTSETPRLSSLGLQVNSKYVADVRSLIYSLDREISEIVAGDLVDEIRTELASIASTYSRLETQIGLQMIPSILAETVFTLREALLAHHGDLTDKLASGSSPGLSDLLRLIYQSTPPGEDPHLVGPLPLWEGARIGAYRDPAVRLIASTLQIDLFKQSVVIDWLLFHFFLSDTMTGFYSEESLAQLKLWHRLLNDTYAAIFYDGICFVCNQPRLVALDNQSRFHNESGAAIVFRDGFEVFSWHGRTVPRDIVLNPDRITVERIESERNVEIRTILVERYGLEQFLSDSRARIIDDDEFGTLYRKEFNREEPLCVVVVKNATAEHDGSFKQYFLRVPPDIVTAKSAVAWTFGLNEDDYEPAVET